DNQIAGPRHAVAAEYGQMRDARLEPNVDDVLLFFKTRPVAFRTGKPRRQIRLHGIAPPRARSRLTEALGRQTRHLGVQNRLAAIDADERRNRRPPRALAR